MRIGVLALQGDFDRHAKALARCGVEAVEVRKPEQLADVDGLIIPGGESTTLLKLMHEWGFVPALQQFHAGGRPLFGTCAGLILLARDVENPRQFALGLIDVGVERNAYGRQRESFETQGSVMLDGRATPVEMVFIRAPRIRRVGASVSTPAPTRRMRGARMKTISTGAARPSRVALPCASNDSRWRPYALRSTPTSMRPSENCRGFSTSRARRMSPAQVPKSGRPSAWNCWSAPTNPHSCMSLRSVVLSPPGMMSPSTSASCSGLRTSTASTPHRASALACRSKSPWSASTPILTMSVAMDYQPRVCIRSFSASFDVS